MHNASVTRDNLPAPMYQHQCCIALKTQSSCETPEGKGTKRRKKRRKHSLMCIIQSCHDSSARCRIKDIRRKEDEKKRRKERDAKLQGRCRAIVSSVKLCVVCLRSKPRRLVVFASCKILVRAWHVVQLVRCCFSAFTLALIKTREGKLTSR